MIPVTKKKVNKYFETNIFKFKKFGKKIVCNVKLFWWEGVEQPLYAKRGLRWTYWNFWLSLKILPAGASTEVILSTDSFRTFCFLKILSVQFSLEGDFHILLKGRKAMLSGNRGPAVAEKRLPEMRTDKIILILRKGGQKCEQTKLYWFLGKLTKILLGWNLPSSTITVFSTSRIFHQ